MTTVERITPEPAIAHKRRDVSDILMAVEMLSNRVDAARDISDARAIHTHLDAIYADLVMVYGFALVTSVMREEVAQAAGQGRLV